MTGTEVSDARAAAVAHPHAHRPRETHLQGYRYGAVLLLLLATYVIEVAAPTGASTRVVVVVLQGLTLVVAMAASHVTRVVIRVTVGILVAAAVAAVAAMPAGGGDDVRGSFYLVSLLFVVAAAVVIVRGLVARPVIDVRTVLGAVCVYVLVGMTFAFGYGAIGTLGHGAFFAQRAHATISDYLYFSFVTLTTTGYGDLTAAGGFARATAVLEALLGQIYLVTVVALLVGAMSHGRRGTEHTLESDGVASGDGTSP